MSWGTVNLSEYILEMLTGKRPKGGAISSGIPSLGAEHLDGSGGFFLHQDKLKYVPEEYYKNLRNGKIKVNDILVVKDGATTGKVSFVSRDFPFSEACINEHVFLIRTKEQLNSKYLFYFLFSDIGKQQILKDFRGATVGGISREFINMLVPFPPREIQQQIVNALDKETSLIEKRKEQIAILEKLAKDTFIYMFGDPENNPMGWDISKLLDVCDVIYRYPTFYGFEYEDSGIPVVKIGNIKLDGKVDDRLRNYDFITEEINSKYPHTQLKLLDTVMAVRGDGSTVKRVGIVLSQNIVGANISPNLLRFSANCDIVSPLYLYHYLVSNAGQRRLERYITKTAKKTITAKDIKTIEIPVPNIELQNKFDMIVISIENQKKFLQASLIELETLYKSTTQKAFNEELFN
jgi:type I restriction enzyme S subunit